jgi:hypothetical protein
VVYDRGVSVVLDVSDLLRGREQVAFLTDVPRAALPPEEAREQEPDARLLEEAQELFPETPSLEGRGEAPRVRRACARSAGTTASATPPSPRSRRRSKRVLNQAGTMIAVRTIGKLERDSIAGDRAQPGDVEGS